MRFHDEKYLRDWKNYGQYPKIHDHMFSLVKSTIHSGSILDLCGCHGLLGQRIKDELGVKVFGAEAKQKWIDLGIEYGISVPTLNTMVTHETLPVFISWISKNEVTGIVARRCLSELFGNKSYGVMADEPNWDFAKEFSVAVAEAGVDQFWVEGRADQGRSVHPIPDTDTEVKCLSFAYADIKRHKNCAYLRRK